jgi:hypothetical protein
MNKYLFLVVASTLAFIFYCGGNRNQPTTSSLNLKGLQLSKVTSFSFPKQQKDSSFVTFVFASLEDTVHRNVVFDTVNIKINGDTISFYPLDSVFADSINESSLISRTHVVSYIFKNLGNKYLKLYQFINLDTVYFQGSFAIVNSSPDTMMKPLSLDTSDLPIHSIP